MDQLNERSKFTLDITFADESGNVADPTSAHWRMYCDTTKTDLHSDWQEIALTTTGTVSIDVSAELTRIINTRNRYEEKVIAIEQDYGLSTQVSHEHRIRVKNLRKTV